MKYKISTSGNILTPNEILENKEGVVNALLNSIGIDDLYVTGNYINEVKDGSNAWTLWKWSGEWIPLFRYYFVYFFWKLPISHIFAGFDNICFQLRYLILFWWNLILLLIWNLELFFLFSIMIILTKYKNLIKFLKCKNNFKLQQKSILQKRFYI